MAKCLFRQFKTIKYLHKVQVHRGNWRRPGHSYSEFRSPEAERPRSTEGTGFGLAAVIQHLKAKQSRSTEGTGFGQAAVVQNLVAERSRSTEGTGFGRAAGGKQQSQQSVMDSFPEANAERKERKERDSTIKF